MEQSLYDYLLKYGYSYSHPEKTRIVFNRIRQILEDSGLLYCENPRSFRGKV